MKYIKTFEKVEDYNIGDYVVLHKKEAWRIWRIFNIAKIIDKDVELDDIQYKYKIETINLYDPNNVKIQINYSQSEVMNKTGQLFWKKNIL